MLTCLNITEKNHQKLARGNLDLKGICRGWSSTDERGRAGPDCVQCGGTQWT